MKQRNIMAVILFSIITLGIYDLFWLFKVKKDLNKLTDVHVPTMWLLFGPVLLLILGIPISIILGLMSEGSTSTGAHAGAGLATLVISFVGMLLIVPTTFYWMFKFSKAVNHYTRGELNTAITFILLWVLRFIGMAIVQDKFNEMLAAGGPGAMSPAMAAPSVGAAPMMPDAMPAAAPQPSVVAPMPAQQPPVDPTQPQSYEQQPPSDPTQQPPTSPNGPLVQ